LYQAINIAGYIYNHCIGLHRRYYRLYGKSLKLYQLQKHITKLKKRPQYVFWNELGSQAIQDIAERIDRGYKLFFRNLKHGIKSAPPSYKKVKKYRSVTLKQCGYKLLDGNRLTIMGQRYKYYKSRDIGGTIKTLTIKRDALGDLYLYLVCDIKENLILPRTGNSVGLDFGLKTFLVASDGMEKESPLFYKQGFNEIRWRNRALSRKKQGSHNRKQAQLNLARAPKKIANQRKDHHFKLAQELAGNYVAICVEDLNIKAMQRLWGRKINDLGHGQFLSILAHQCAKTGSRLISIDRFYRQVKLALIAAIFSMLCLSKSVDGLVPIVGQSIIETRMLRIIFIGLGRQPLEERLQDLL